MRIVKLGNAQSRCSPIYLWHKRTIITGSRFIVYTSVPVQYEYLSGMSQFEIRYPVLYIIRRVFQYVRTVHTGTRTFCTFRTLFRVILSIIQFSD